MRQKSQTRQTGAAKAIKDIRRATRKGGVRLIRTSLRCARKRQVHAAICRHSAKAAKRFCLKVSRGVS